jgi:hypothetical protein
MTYDSELVSLNYREGVLAGDALADTALRDGYIGLTAREAELREEADTYRLPTQAARNLRARTLGMARGYRHGIWEVR